MKFEDALKLYQDTMADQYHVYGRSSPYSGFVYSRRTYRNCPTAVSLCIEIPGTRNPVLAEYRVYSPWAQWVSTPNKVCVVVVCFY